jgi:hypothetical protein
VTLTAKSHAENVTDEEDMTTRLGCSPDESKGSSHMKSLLRVIPVASQPFLPYFIATPTWWDSKIRGYRRTVEGIPSKIEISLNTKPKTAEIRRRSIIECAVDETKTRN